MEFLSEYGMFLLKAITIVVAILVVVGAAANASQKHKKHTEGSFEVNNLSDEIEEIKDDLLKEIMSEEDYKALQKEKKKKEKEEAKQKKKEEKAAKKAKKSDSSTDSDDSEESEDEKSRIFVLNFDGDVEASGVENLREEISAVITAAEEGDTVLLRLESPGGMVHSYGLAASQLTRLREAKLKLVIAVDQVAASGGYMMACVADEIIAAPFAVVGSIGVVAELPNFHRLLKNNYVDYEQHTAGEYKRTLTMFAENTDAAREKFKEELQETHDLFKEFITVNRPALDIDKVATGEHWYGTTALKLGLIDKIQTSDDYILHNAKDNEVFEINYEIKKPLAERLSLSIQGAVEKGFLAVWKKSIESRLFKS
ncbi:protease SohB [Aliikangiella marina]|uniref:Protease SohB n=1 Tax=Aliikangiella marina TaxID=1712262 RepID=A0A545TED8_9GAMM|nr:protease SohB [Aliikangiella marina]TQV75588.1 protease SohB [Aliikangiella marina]